VSGHTRYPVFDGDLDHIVGYIHIKELVSLVEAGRPVTAADAHPIPQVPDTAPLDDVLGMFRKHAAPMAVVFDEHGGTAGVITLEDLFYEVAGDIPEGLASEASIAPDPRGGFRVEGTVRIDKVGEALGVELEHEDVDSVSGLVLAVLGRLPVVGEAIEYDHVRFEVTKVERHGVGEAWATNVPAPASEGGG
jgi:CBS domain containing-hemolysin-like protein